LDASIKHINASSEPKKHKRVFVGIKPVKRGQQLTVRRREQLMQDGNEKIDCRKSV